MIIHDGNIFGVFIEIGCGMPLSQRLLEIEGASKTVYSALSPYNKQAQTELFGESDNRSVSFEFVKNIINNTKTPENVNTIFVSSFQLGIDICNHGWIGLKHKDITKYYHITIPHYMMKTYGRKYVIETIGDISLAILYNGNVNYCDIIRDEYEFLRYVFII